MAKSIPVPPASGAVERPASAWVAVREWPAEAAAGPPRWLVMSGLVAYCALIWALVAVGGVAVAQFALEVLS